ncbi:MAG: LptF/LptG family permease [Planctomycetes bacterium]|nr:LptF/LptG family permease [Planctomycetota bacterium]
MRTISKIDRYIGMYFISSYIICFIFFLGLFVVIDLVPKVDNILDTAPLAAEKGRSLFLMTGWYYLMKVPEIFLMVAPYLTVMAAMFCMSRLRKNNELIPMIMAGVSIFRVLLPIFVCSAFLLVGMVFVQELVAPYCAGQRMLEESFLLDQEEQLLIERKVFWDQEGREIVVKNFNVATQVIGGANISFLEQEAGQVINTSIKGRLLRWLGPEERAWSMEEGTQVTENLSDLEANSIQKPIKVFYTDLTPDDIITSLKDPNEMTFKEIQRAYALNTKDKRWKILLHYHITFPLSNMLLLLLGLPFVLRYETRSNFLGLAIALFICGGYFILDVIMRDLGTKDQIHPIIAAWFASIFCGAVGIYLFDSIKS